MIALRVPVPLTRLKAVQSCRGRMRAAMIELAEGGRRKGGLRLAGVVARVVRLQEEGIFRAIVGYL